MASVANDRDLNEVAGAENIAPISSVQIDALVVL